MTKENKESHFAGLPIYWHIAWWHLACAGDEDGDDGDAVNDGDDGDGDESDDEEEEEVDKQGKLANLLARTLADLLWPLACLTPFKFNLYFHLNSDERQTCPTSYL